MNKSQELMERINSLQSMQDSGTIDFERDKEAIEDTYGPIVEMSDEDFYSFLQAEAEKRGQVWE